MGQPAVQPAVTPRVMPSRFPSTCISCHRRIERGVMITWTGRGQAAHVDCNAQPVPETETATQPVPVAPKPARQIIEQPVTNSDALSNLASAIKAIASQSIDRETVREMIDAALASAEPRTVRVVIENKTTGESAATLPTDHANMSQLLYLLSKRHHVYLYGAPGSGKSTAASQAAERMKIPYGYISLNPQTTDSRLIGYMDANRNFHETVFYNCYKNGGVFCIDEMDNSAPSLLTTLNGALENGHCAFPCGLVERHKDFVLVATGNTCGRGANAQFPDRRPFDAAFGERFTFIEWGYDADLEQSITLAINPNAQAWLTWITELRPYCQTNYPRVLVSPRASFRGAEYLRDAMLTADQIADMVVFKGIDRATKQAILRAYPIPSDLR